MSAEAPDVEAEIFNHTRGLIESGVSAKYLAWMEIVKIQDLIAIEKRGLDLSQRDTELDMLASGENRLIVTRTFNNEDFEAQELDYWITEIDINGEAFERSSYTMAYRLPNGDIFAVDEYDGFELDHEQATIVAQLGDALAETGWQPKRKARLA